MIKRGSIKGLVVDMSGQPVVQAAVLINGDNASQQDKVNMTNEAGEYVINEVEPGTYTVSINSTGRVTVSREVSVIANSVSILDFLLGY